MDLTKVLKNQKYEYLTASTATTEASVAVRYLPLTNGIALSVGDAAPASATGFDHRHSQIFLPEDLLEFGKALKRLARKMLDTESRDSEGGAPKPTAEDPAEETVQVTLTHKQAGAIACALHLVYIHNTSEWRSKRFSREVQCYLDDAALDLAEQIQRGVPVGDTLDLLFGGKG